MPRVKKPPKKFNPPTLQEAGQLLERAAAQLSNDKLAKECLDMAKAIKKVK